jgi:hypothetical protein
MVGDRDVSRPERQGGRREAHAKPQGAEVHGDVRRVDHQLAMGVEKGAGEIQALLDVGGNGGALEALAHLVGDGGEAMSEQLQLDGAGPPSSRGAGGRRLAAHARPRRRSRPTTAWRRGQRASMASAAAAQITREYRALPVTTAITRPSAAVASRST